MSLSRGMVRKWSSGVFMPFWQTKVNDIERSERETAQILRSYVAVEQSEDKHMNQIDRRRWLESLRLFVATEPLLRPLFTWPSPSPRTSPGESLIPVP